MTYPALISALDSSGVRLGLRLTVDAPSGAITAEVRESLAEHKPLILSKLAREAQWEALKDLRWGPAICDPTPVSQEASA